MSPCVNEPLYVNIMDKYMYVNITMKEIKEYEYTKMTMITTKVDETLCVNISPYTRNQTIEI
jgi:hypothetical protein